MSLLVSLLRPFKRSLRTLAPSLALTLALALASAPLAEARCTGVDLRDHLTESARAQLAQELAKVPYGTGNHWIATRDGQRIDIFGTQHSGDSRMWSQMRVIRPLVRAADAVFLEVTEPQMQSADQDPEGFARYFSLPKGKRLDQMMSAADWTRLSGQLAEAGIDPATALFMQPWYLSDFLTGTDCRKRGFGSRQGLDDRIEAAARRQGVPALGLEDPEAGLAALAAMPLGDQLKMLLLDSKSATRHEDLYVTLSEAYFDGRLTEGRIVMGWMMYRDLDVSRREVRRLLQSFDARVLDQRNRAWAKRLAGRQEPRLVVAVGAAHLAGSAGLLALLAQRGYTLTQAEE